MARPPKDGTTTPREMAEVEPHELFPTNNIRHVITETGKLTERVDSLSRAVEKVPAAMEAQGQKLASAIEKISDKLAADFKDRTNEIKAGAKDRADEIRKDLTEKTSEIKVEVKDVRNSVVELEKNLSFYRGALRTLGLAFALLVVIVGAVAKYLLDKLP